MIKRYTGLFATVLIGLSLSLGGIQDAEAKRFGGGSSFGGKSAFSMPYKRSAAQPAKSPSQQQATNQNQTAKQQLAKRGGLMGMLGGLALGGLLGAMLFGGAFEGINFVDILMFAGIAFLLYKLFAAKAGSARKPAYSYERSGYDETGSDNVANNAQPQVANSSSAFNTDLLFKKDKFAETANAAMSYQQDADFNNPIVPAGFNEADFLAGAKNAYKSLQLAWDQRDLAEIRSLTTDKVFGEIQDQLKASSDENHTDILKLDAELLEVREIGQDLEAVVLFDAIMREDKDSQANQVKEIWHFTKTKNSIQPKWYLDGIQQLED